MHPHPDDFKPALSLVDNVTARITAKVLSGTIHDISEFSFILPLRMHNGEVASNGHRTRVAVSRYAAPPGKEGPSWDIMVFDDNAQPWGESNFYIGILANGGETFMCIWYYSLATGAWLDSQKIEPGMAYKLPPCASLTLGDDRWSKNALVLELRSNFLPHLGRWNGLMAPQSAYADFRMGLPTPLMWPAQYTGQLAMALFPLLPPHMQQYQGCLVPGNPYQMQMTAHGPKSMMYPGRGMHIGYAHLGPGHTHGQGGGNWLGGGHGGTIVRPPLAGAPAYPSCYTNGNYNKQQCRTFSERNPPITGWARNYPNLGRGSDNIKNGGLQGQGSRGPSGSRGSPPFGPKRNGSNNSKNNAQSMQRRKVSIATPAAEAKMLASQPEPPSSNNPSGEQSSVSDTRVVVAYVGRELTMGKTASEPARPESEDGFELGRTPRRASVSVVLESPAKEDSSDTPCIAHSYTYE